MVEFGFILRLSMRIVETAHVNPCLQEAQQDGMALRGGTDGGDDSSGARQDSAPSLVEQSNDELVHHNIVEPFVLDAERPFAVPVGAVGVGEHVG